jgi:hypothetical protein
MVPAMEAVGDHFAVVIGASRTAEQLRRYFVTRGTPYTGVATHLRGLRRGLLLGRPEMAIVCVALNRPTLDRHGEDLQRLMADLRGFPTPVHSIGLVPPSTLLSHVAHLGCDIYVGGLEEATDVMAVLRRRWQRDHVAARRAELLRLWDEEAPGPEAGGRWTSSSPRISGWRLWPADEGTEFPWSFGPSHIRRPATGIGRQEASD